MKILAIRLKNLTSIEGTVEVDFTAEPLHSAGIFAISGPTGAGKSTLLDALCLALYDKAPRFATSVESVNLADVGDNQINQSDVRNLLRRGTSDGYAEVDFLGIDGRRYRSRWSVRRTRNKISGSLQPQTLEVKELDTEYSKLLTEKKALYPDYRKAKEEMQELLRAKRNVELFFAEEKSSTEKTKSR